MPKKKVAQASSRKPCANKKLLQQSQARKQAQEQARARATETTNAISQQQSQELTQSLLLASISSVLHLRDLVHPDCFQLTHFDIESAEPWSYEKWKNGKMKTKNNDHTQSMHLLQREGSVKAQAFMDYIVCYLSEEYGAFDAIRRGFLEAFQLKVFVDPDHQENVLETHTLHFSYHRPPGCVENIISGVELAGPEGKRLSLVNMKIGFADFVRSLSMYVDNLPELPEKRYFKPKVFYTDCCPEEYQAPGFVAPKTGAVGFPQNEELVRKTHQLNLYSGGFYSVNMSITHMQWLHKGDGAVPAGSGLIYLSETSAPSVAATPAPDSVSSQAGSENGTEGRVGRRASVQANETPVESGPLSDDIRTFHQPSGARVCTSKTAVPACENNPKSAGTREYRQRPDDGSDLRKISNFDQPTVFPKALQAETPSRESSMQVAPSTVCNTHSHISHSDSEMLRQNGGKVQGNLKIGSARENRAMRRNTTRSGIDSQDKRERNTLKNLRQQPESQAHDTQPAGEDGVAIEAANATTREGRVLKLILTKIEELDERKQLSDTFGGATRCTWKKSGDTDEISCQCGWNREEEDNMIYCNWCSTWQHCSCYGYRGSSDPRIPLEHACYSCLEGVAEAGEARRKLKELKSFALLRRAIRVIEEHGFSDEASFAKALGGCDLQTASDVLARLVSEKAVVIRNAKGATDKSKRSRYRAAIVVPERPEVMAKFFNPVYNIEDCYTSEARDVTSPITKSQKSPRFISPNTGDVHARRLEPSGENELKESSAVPSGFTEELPLAQTSRQYFETQSEPTERPDEESQGKGTLKRRQRTTWEESGFNSPRPTKRVHHGSPMTFMRGMSADA